MPENKHRNPFEDHINSESFDVSNLVDAVREPSELELEIEAFFDSLPDKLDLTLWDNDLDTRQKIISAHVTTILAEKILREDHADTLEGITDAELIHLLTVPITLAMLAEQRLHTVDKKPNPIDVPPITPPSYDDFADLPPNWGDILNDMFLRAKDFIISLFRRN